jgi:hypothetical protein
VVDDEAQTVRNVLAWLGVTGDEVASTVLRQLHEILAR